MDTKSLSKLIQLSCEKSIRDFLDAESSVQAKNLDNIADLDSVSGASIEVRGDTFSYRCLLEYKAEDSLKFLDLLHSKYPFINEEDLPEIDILDFLGEFLNILCGKLNLELEKSYPDLHIEIPYFLTGMDAEEVTAQNFSFGGLSFNLYCAIL